MAIEDHEPWPLLVIETIDYKQMEGDGDDIAERVLRSMMERVRITAEKMLREAGRMHEVRQLKLYCYNYDTTKEKE